MVPPDYILISTKLPEAVIARTFFLYNAAAFFSAIVIICCWFGTVWIVNHVPLMF
jgi:hypothetical protein